MSKIIILGSGIQGMSAAFSLNKQGYEVMIIEKESRIFNMTSLYQEGRIHLGFTYGLDSTCETGKSVLLNSYHFSLLFDKWFGKINWNKYLMPKGYYLVHKNTFLTIDNLVKYFEKLEDYSTELLDNDQEISYFDKRPKSLFKVLEKTPPSMSPKNINHVIETAERIVEVFYFRELLIEQLKKTNIKVVINTEVVEITRESKGFTILCKTKDSREARLRSDIVVNCLWNNRIKIDNTMHVKTIDDPLYRFKIGILGTVDVEVPTCSIVSGVFGNISPRLDKKHAYISWHKECMQGIRTNGVTPKEWEETISNPSSISLNATWIQNTIKKVSEFVPALETFKPIRLLPGIICSAGESDIGDRNSKVHFRGAHMGVYSFDGYYSVDTGKFCSAPYYAELLTREIIENERT